MCGRVQDHDPTTTRTPRARIRSSPRAIVCANDHFAGEQLCHRTDADRVFGPSALLIDSLHRVIGPDPFLQAVVINLVLNSRAHARFYVSPCFLNCFKRSTIGKAILSDRKSLRCASVAKIKVEIWRQIWGQFFPSGAAHRYPPVDVRLNRSGDTLSGNLQPQFCDALGCCRYPTSGSRYTRIKPASRGQDVNFMWIL
jgi:hypothetical protein